MTPKILHVIATLTALAGKEKELSDALQTLIAPTRQEEGCIRYELLQNRQRPEQFIFVEEWKDDAVLDKHLVSSHVQEALGKATALLSKTPDIIRCNRIL